jgi:phenylalanyl-tRNA synthetase beta chain
MGIQEKLHLTLGRKRVKVAIGVHDYDHVEPPFTYKAIDPEGVTFVPLFKDEEMDLAEILRKHEKGIDYAFTLEGFDRYPIIIDRNWDVLSFPPIINGELTAVTETTTNLFLDVTGNDAKTVYYALNILATMLAERGGQIYTVEVKYPDRIEILPDLDARDMELDISMTNRFLGTDFSIDNISLYLSKMGFDTIPSERDNKNILIVKIPAYRTDILHTVDLIEDVAVGYGYDNFSTLLPQSMTFGETRPLEEICEHIKYFFVGQGFLEVMTLALSNDDDQFRKMGMPVGERVIIKNPISKDHTNIRVWLLPTLLNILKSNLHRDLPQRIFEVGDIVLNGNNFRKVGGLAIHRKASFTEIKGLVKSLLSAFGINDYDIVPVEHPSFVVGRTGQVVFSKGPAGIFGELHPRTITRFSLGNPIIAFEFNVGAFGL